MLTAEAIARIDINLQNELMKAMVIDADLWEFHGIQSLYTSGRVRSCPSMADLASRRQKLSWSELRRRNLAPRLATSNV